ncbi:MAG: hypothetical protein R3F14_08625 [Polyangiaceae bacterium]
MGDEEIDVAEVRVAGEGEPAAGGDAADRSCPWKSSLAICLLGADLRERLASAGVL